MTTALRRITRLGGTAALLGALALGAGTASAQPTASVRPAVSGQPAAWTAAGEQAAAAAVFTTWATDVNMRHDLNHVNGWACPEHPSPGNCPDVIGRAQPGDQLEVSCQTRGETVGGNPYWVFAHNRTRGIHGWMASYFIAHPDDVLPGVPTPCMGP
ncbi:hypothetical protein ABT033_09620 [Streptomyces pharetrae]|uniref:hypothetical protein n=1 Tax=Streptomyces pharetrae TaxID=291370 RepID=UPI00335F9CA8